MKLTLLLIFAIVVVSAYAQQPVSLNETLEWMHNFAADNGRQYTGRRILITGPAKWVYLTASNGRM